MTPQEMDHLRFTEELKRVWVDQVVPLTFPIRRKPQGVRIIDLEIDWDVPVVTYWGAYV